MLSASADANSVVVVLGFTPFLCTLRPSSAACRGRKVAMGVGWAMGL